MRKENTQNTKQIIALDFFCGCGGVAHGMIKAGIKVLAGFDNNSKLKSNFERNNPGAKFVEADIANKEKLIEDIKDVLRNHKKSFKIFSACAPCQPFSLHNRNYENDDRKNLMLSFINVIGSLPKRFRPNVIFAENVGPMKKRGEHVVSAVLKKLTALDYCILPPKVINAYEFGVPQNRKRLIYVALRRENLIHEDRFSWDYLYKHYKEEGGTVQQAIGRLPPIPAGLKVNEEDPLHITRCLSEKNLRRIKQITVPGGSRNMWDKRLNLTCYENHEGHRDVYGRMNWNKPAPTLTCRCISISNGRFGHPEQDRAISIREAAILQTMDDFLFEKPILMTNIAQQIGNAVPPKLAEKFGKYFLELIK